MKFDDRPVSELVADMYEEDWKKKQSIDKEDFTIAEAEHDKMHERLDTMDAMIWTNEFMKIRYEKLRKENFDIAADEGTMLGWFANAIMKGYDNGCRVGEENGLEMAARKKEELNKMVKKEDIITSLHKELDELLSRFNRIYKETSNVVDIQAQDGNWNFDPYMHGMLNGMKLIQSIIHDVEPEYVDAPKQWLNDKTKIEDVMSTDEYKTGFKAGQEAGYAEGLDHGKTDWNKVSKDIRNLIAESENDNYDKAMALVSK